MRTTSKPQIAIYALAFTLISFSGLSQHYHVVIGAFAVESNARKFTVYARGQHLNATYEFNGQNNLFYVSIMKTTRKEDAYAWAVHLQEDTEFKDAWLFLSDDSFVSNKTVRGVKIIMPLNVARSKQPVNQQKTNLVSTRNASLNKGHMQYTSSRNNQSLIREGTLLTPGVISPQLLEQAEQGNVIQYNFIMNILSFNAEQTNYYVPLNNKDQPGAIITMAGSSESEVALSEENRWNEEWIITEDVDYSIMKNVPLLDDVKNEIARSSAKMFKFLIETNEQKAVAGEVHIVDFEKERDIALFNASENIAFKPKNKRKPLTAIHGTVGYKDAIQFIDLEDPASTEKAKQNEHGVWEIPFKLESLEKGDVSVMYGVSFHKDAAILLPQSKEDINKLMAMMKSNPGYRVRIHSHCNGNQKRTIKTLGKDKNYFDEQDFIELSGSAKLLTILRAETIRSYLVDNGIEKNRIDIFPWGGTDSLVKKTSPHAKLNDRVEIEILED